MKTNLFCISKINYFFSCLCLLIKPIYDILIYIMKKLKTEYLASLLPAKAEAMVMANIHFIKYGIIGVCGLGIDFSIYYFLVEYTPIHYQVANAISVIITLTNNFLWNYYLNFKLEDKFWIRLLRYYLIGGAGLMVSFLGLHVLVEFIHLSEILSKPVVLVFVTLSQYYLNKHITFKE